MAIRTVIVDDEKPSREEIKLFLKRFPNFELSGEFDNAFDALSFMVSTTVDVAFFDINMPGFDGIRLAEVLKGTENSPVIVFVTAYSEHAVKAFEVDAIDYILKPID
ncbi:MAG: response regulator, partial [Caldiserica bacterium]|nr:response regulator [Caldisericota bacterium]